MLKKYMKYMPYLILALIAVAAYSVVDARMTAKMMGLLDYALEGRMDIVRKTAPELIALAAILVPLGLLVTLTNHFYRMKSTAGMKHYYISKVFGKNLAEFQKDNNAKYMSAITNDFNTLELNLIGGVFSIANCIAKFLVGIWLLSTVDYRMILLAFVIIMVNIAISSIISKPSNKAYKERSDMFDGYTSYIKEILSAFHIVKNYGLQEKVTGDYEKKSDDIQHKWFLIERMLTFVYATENFFTSASIYGVVAIMGYMVITGRITTGGLLLVVEGITRMMFPLFELSEALPKIFTVRDLIRKIEDTLKNRDNYVETVELSELNNEIRFENVSFAYEDSEEATLDNINLKLRKNGKYLIVGPSGGGKSTLLKLFRKYYNPTSGTISIDGHNLRDVERDSYYKLIANIEQQVFIFEDTVRNNITLYKDYSEEEINEAIRAAGLEDFVSKLPKGLDTVIYDNGKNISGGERSRIVIARALLSKASILLMDEAFASLDMERAREIEKTILSLKDMTVINVSHVIFKDTQHLYDKVLTVKRTIFE